MPLGSSSAAPVTKPGPNRFRKPVGVVPASTQSANDHSEAEDNSLHYRQAMSEEAGAGGRVRWCSRRRPERDDVACKIADFLPRQMWIWHGRVGRHKPVSQSFHRLISAIGNAWKAGHIRCRGAAGGFVDQMTADTKFAS